MIVDQILSDALEKHKAGDMDSAEALYRKILSNHPSDADALNLLGVLSLQRGDLDQAQDLLSRAVQANPQIAEIHNNLGQVRMHQCRKQDAAECFRQALKINPDLKIARINLETANSGDTIPSISARPPMKRYEVVQQVLNTLHGRTYLEIGIDTAQSFLNIRAPRKVGIDPVPTFNLINQMLSIFDIHKFQYRCSADTGEASLELQAKTDRKVAHMPPGESADFFYETSDAFFAKRATDLFARHPIDTAFVDGLHTYRQTHQDVLNVLNYLAPRGVVLMHDCNPPAAASAHPAESWQAAAEMRLPGWDGLWCGDVWKALVLLRSTRRDLNIFVLDCDFGIGVVSRGKPDNMVNLSQSQIDNLTYADLSSHRNALINLKPQEYLYEFLKTIA